MGYFDEQQRIVDYVTRDGMIIELTQNKDNLKSNYQVLETYADSSQLAIKYPGYKTTRAKCDYCVYLVDEDGEHPISHVEIMTDLYNKTTMQNYKHMKQYIEDVATIGRDINIDISLLSGFDIESHKRLANLFVELTARGCYCMLTNHNTDLINELYGNKGYRIDVVSVKRMINSDASNRVGEEVIICNY